MENKQKKNILLRGRSTFGEFIVNYVMAMAAVAAIIFTM